MSMISSNVGSADRIIRVLVGLALIAFALFGPAETEWKWAGWIGVVPLLTGLLKWCPAYTLLGVNTCGR